MGRKLNKNLIYFLLTAVFFTAITWPVLYTFISLFQTKFNLFEVIDCQMIIVILKSVLMAVLVAGISTLAGSLLALILYKSTCVYTRFFKFLLFIPLLLSAYVFTVAYDDFFTLIVKQPQFLHHLGGVIFILVLHFTPLAVLITGSSLNRISSGVEESALLLSRPRDVVLKIIFPLIKPALFTSFALIFVFALADFTVPSLLNVKVFSTEIFTRFSAFYQHSLAVWQSLILIFISAFLLLREWKNIDAAPFFSIGTKGLDVHKYDTSKVLMRSILFFWVILSLFLPLAVLIYQTFYGGTQSFVQAFTILKEAFSNSVFLAFSGALISVITGFVAEYFHYKFRYKSLNTLLLLGFIISPVVLGISLINFYNHRFLAYIYASAGILFIAYAGKFSFIPAKIIENGLRQIPGSLQESAALSGASEYQQIFKILLPLLYQAVFAGFLLVFILIFNELAVSVMLYPPSMDLLPVKVFTRMANAPETLTAAMTLCVFIANLLLILLFYFFYHQLIKRNYATR